MERKAPMDPEQSRTVRTVICTECGTVAEDVADQMAAELVRDDHEREAPCSGDVEISSFEPKAVDTVVLEDGQDRCPVCFRPQYDDEPDECDRCGVAFVVDTQVGA